MDVLIDAAICVFDYLFCRQNWHLTSSTQRIVLTGNSFSIWISWSQESQVGVSTLVLLDSFFALS